MPMTRCMSIKALEDAVGLNNVDSYESRCSTKGCPNFILIIRDTEVPRIINNSP